MHQIGDQRYMLARLAQQQHDVLQIGLCDHEQYGPDDRTIERTHAADHGDQQNVDHHFERECGVRAVVAQPDRHEDASQRGEDSRDHARYGSVEDCAIADCFGSERILANGLKHASEWRVRDPQHQQEQHRDRDKDGIIGQDAPIDDDPHHGLVE